MTQTRAADILARRLYDAGCRHVFGMPGGEVLTLLDAFEAAGLGFTLVRHENAGGFIAEGVHHVDGAPAVLLATVGPGALNAINVVENARQDRVPMIVVTGAIDADEAERYTHQVLDQRAVFGAICKASFTFSAGAAEVIADKAVRIATDPRPGPVHIDVPVSVADAPAEARPALRRRPALPVAPAPSAEFEAARQAVAEAKRPLIVAGVDAVNEGAGDAILRAVEALGAPLVTSYKGKGLIPETHELSLGGAGLSPKADKHLLRLVADADVVILAGYDPIEMRTGWQDAVDPGSQSVIDISAAPNLHYMHQGSVNVIGGVGPSLDALTEGAGRASGWGDRIAETRAALSQAFAPEPDWGPGVVIETCRQVLPETTRATADSGAHRILLSQMWTTYAPRGLVQSSGLCTMGCAVPLAIGLSLAAPDVPVVSFSGDAGFLMVAGELATAAELGVRPIFVVFVDRSLALIEMKQRQRQLPNAGVDFAGTDFPGLARAMGGQGVQVSSRDGLEAALAEALKADTFTLIAAEIDRRAYDGRI
ncbi:acetolactate synthase-1/2/3 large subunit [Roseivivax halotolerans]|uniref:Acetolactate synthase-1/2/3 large subunit n=1 Tax=Roseivivax halotolerans TaxID=93684 RepID=A0A1I5X9G2_9RHOB|nr:thiamine pyrophosphate-binding protein [Roseivivax halotolerans]SFQ28612.1 acetolactate synthase-1/2/3 large subunit [Roseivivax halotolerans]